MSDSHTSHSRLDHLILAFLACATLVSTACAAEVEYALPQSEWKPLFNGRDLSNWNKFLATPGSDAPLVANVDPKGVFTVTNLNGENLIHVSGEAYGAITTQEEFTNFHFRVQFKWGLNRWGGAGECWARLGHSLLWDRPAKFAHGLAPVGREQHHGERRRPVVERQWRDHRRRG